jgi:peptidoglycan/xylan/chitin deacetylase (PgdA/CDA1 family)
VEVGSHTVTHPILSRVSAERAQREIEESKEYIEDKLGREVLAFAYPNGMPEDYTPKEKETLRETGYNYAVSCTFGFNTPDSDVFELKRITAQYEMARFAQEVSGFVKLREKVFA